MCRESKGHHGHSCGCGCDCGRGCNCDCGCHSRLGPAFWTKAEKIAWLEEYLDSLRENVNKVEARIAALKEA